MTASEGFVALLKELLDPLGTVVVRRMFGGAGIYVDGLFIAIIADDALYLKTDVSTCKAYENAGSEPFRYDTKKGPNVLISYWRVPDALFDDGEEMRQWAGEALRVARTAAAEKRKAPTVKPGRRAPPRGGKSRK